MTTGRSSTILSTILRILIRRVIQGRFLAWYGNQRLPTSNMHFTKVGAHISKEFDDHLPNWGSQPGAMAMYRDFHRAQQRKQGKGSEIDWTDPRIREYTPDEVESNAKYLDLSEYATNLGNFVKVRLASQQGNRHCINGCRRHIYVPLLARRKRVVRYPLIPYFQHLCWW